MGRFVLVNAHTERKPDELAFDGVGASPPLRGGD